MNEPHESFGTRRSDRSALIRVSGISRRLFGLSPKAVERRLAELADLLDAAERDSASAREQSAAAAARAEELAAQIGTWRARQQALDEAYARIVDLERQMIETAQERSKRLLEAATSEAEELTRQAHELAGRIESEGLAEAHAAAQDAERLRGFHAELEAAIRGALGRFEQALDDLAAAPVELPSQRVPEPPESPRLAVVDAPAPDAAAETPARVAASVPEELHEVAITLHPVVDFSHLAQLEESIALHSQVRDVHVQAYDGETANLGAMVPLNVSCSSLVAEAVGGSVHDRSPTQVDVDLSAVLPGRARPVS